LETFCLAVKISDDFYSNSLQKETLNYVCEDSKIWLVPLQNFCLPVTVFFRCIKKEKIHLSLLR